MTTAIRLGCLGTDSSHLIEFARRIKQLHDLGRTRCLVTRFWSDGQHDLPADQVAKWEKETLDLGVVRAKSMEEVLEQTDGVLVLALSGNRHFPLAMPALERGLAVYVDKPFTCDLSQARLLLDTCRQNNARCFSASSLRFAHEIETLPRKALGDLVAIDATGPGQMNASMPGLFYYGVHTIELVDALFGKGGVRRVRATSDAAREVVDLEYTDGRVAHLRLERKASYDFAGIVHGTKGLHAFHVNFAGVYDRLIESMAAFFEGGKPPVDLRDIVENIAVMEAGNRSIASGGAWVDVPIVK